MRPVVIVEAVYQRMPLECLLDDASLHTFPPSMYQANLSKAGGVRLVDVLLDHRGNIARLEGVQIELSLNRDAHSSS